MRFIHGAYWNANAVSFHPVVVYFREEDVLKHVSYVFVSDDHGHNIRSVYVIMKKLQINDRRSIQGEIKTA